MSDSSAGKSCSLFRMVYVGILLTVLQEGMLWL